MSVTVQRKPLNGVQRNTPIPSTALSGFSPVRGRFPLGLPPLRGFSQFLRAHTRICKVPHIRTNAEGGPLVLPPPAPPSALAGQYRGERYQEPLDRHPDIGSAGGPSRTLLSDPS